jgi:translation initiation factor 1A
MTSKSPLTLGLTCSIGMSYFPIQQETAGRRQQSIKEDTTYTENDRLCDIYLSMYIYVIKILKLVKFFTMIRGVNLSFYKKNQNTQDEVVRVRVPRKQDREILGVVESMLGANKIKVRCMDGVVRLGRIPGKLKKRTWIRAGDIVIVVPWDFQDDKADVKWRYTKPQVDWLEKKGYLKG